MIFVTLAAFDCSRRMLEEYLARSILVYTSILPSKQNINSSIKLIRCQEFRELKVGSYGRNVRALKELEDHRDSTIQAIPVNNSNANHATRSPITSLAFFPMTSC